MSKPIRVTYEIVGPHPVAESALVHRHHFVKGECGIVCQSDMVSGLDNVFRRYQAYRVGTPEHAEMKEKYHGVRPESAEGPVGHPADEAGGDGHGPEPTGAAPEGAAVGEADAGADGGDAGSGPDGDGHENSGVAVEPAEVNHRLRAAVESLDPLVDDHWTRAGLPAIAAVEQAYGSTGITRADVEFAKPGHTRDAALDAALDGDGDAGDDGTE